MTRVAIYSRFSSQMQSEASIEDQLRICQERAVREGWTVTAVFSDMAISGASMQRPGIQNLMEQASRGSFDIVMTEALDRLSRDQADVATLFKRLSFHGVRIITLLIVIKLCLFVEKRTWTRRTLFSCSSTVV